VQATALGWVARTRTLNDIWTLNRVHVSRPASAKEVIAVTDDYQADLAFRHIVVEDEGTAHELEGGLTGAGWKVHREVHMALIAPPEWVVESGPPEGVVDLTPDQMLVLMRRWLEEDYPGISAARMEQLDEYNRREGALWNERRFGVLGHNGTPAALTKLRARTQTAWVEDVYTVPEERRHGHARKLVAHAVGLALSGGYDLTFITADDKDWPKHLYARAGFRPVGLTWTFHRDLEDREGQSCKSCN